MKIFCCPVSQASIYNQMLFCSIRDRYQPVFAEEAGLAEAVGHLQAGIAVLLHVQWEEFFLRDAKTENDAVEFVEKTVANLQHYHDLGGKIVWTVHNGLPHRMPHRKQFLTLRRFIAKVADVILIHNKTSIEFLHKQIGLDPARVQILPHPSYLGFYEAEGVAASQLTAPERVILGFGEIRRQKGFAQMLEMLPESFTQSRQAVIRLSGRGKEGLRLQQLYQPRKDVQFDLRYVPQQQVADQIRSAACVVLPYRHFLTSGVAHLVLTLGGILVAPDAPQHRELLPESAHQFLYRPDDAADLQRALSAVLALSPAERQAVQRAGLAVAEALHPAQISNALGMIYDHLASHIHLPIPEYQRAIADMDKLDEDHPSANGLLPSDDPVIGSWAIGGKVGDNWGDKLNPALMALLSGRAVVHAEHTAVGVEIANCKMIGSGLSTANAYQSVWGSGFIAKRDAIPTPRAIAAVRGPLSRAKLIAAGMNCPEVYGDAAVLMPLFYRPPIQPTYDLGIIQHFREAGVEPLPVVPVGMKVKIIDICGTVPGVIDEILTCREIVSSSLHGLIAAHAYGIAATWIKFSNRPKGDDFKFADYLASVGWRDARPLWITPGMSCADLVGPKTRRRPLLDITTLIRSCPFITTQRRDAVLRRAEERFPVMPDIAFLSVAAGQA